MPIADKDENEQTDLISEIRGSLFRKGFSFYLIDFDDSISI